MISLLTQKIIDIIKDKDNPQVYSEYDMIPVENKSENFYTVVSVVDFSGKDVKNVLAGTAYDFEINYNVICLAGRNFKAIDFYDYIQEKILKRIISSEDIKVLEFKTGKAEFDYKLQKMKIICSLKIGGIYLVENK